MSVNGLCDKRQQPYPPSRLTDAARAFLPSSLADTGPPRAVVPATFAFFQTSDDHQRA